MTYHDWFVQHAKKHREIVSRLEHLSDEEVIAYFRYGNMVVHEPDFCPLYARGTRCHEMEDLNCYLCACPHFQHAPYREIRSKESHCSIQKPPLPLWG